MSFPFLHTTCAYTTFGSHPGGSRGTPKKRACQLRNVVHDWITRGCIAIVLRLLVRHGVGGRGCAGSICRQHPAVSTRIAVSSLFFSALLFLHLSFSFNFSLFLPLFCPPFISLSLSSPSLASRARTAEPKRNEHPINQQSETIWSLRCYLRPQPRPLDRGHLETLRQRKNRIGTPAVKNSNVGITLQANIY